MAVEATDNLPLSGIRVLDISAVIMGPYCTQILGDLGADVIKVEALEGDIIRGVGPKRTKGMTAMFLTSNRGKRSVALDLNHPRGRAALDGLIRGADVMVHSMRPNGIARMRLDYETVKAVEPRLIYCALLGFGLGGRYAGKPAYDDVIQAACGLAGLEAEIRGKPGYAPTVMADKVTALTAVYSIMAALLYRGRTGVGQKLEVPMFETMVSFTLVEHLGGAIYDPPIGRPVYARPVSPNRHPYRTTTDYIAAMVHTDRNFHRFCDIVGRPELKSDPRFVDVSARTVNVKVYYEFLEEELAKRSAEEWVEVLERAEMPVQKIFTTDEVLHDPHLADVGYFKQVEQPGDGMLRVPGFPVDFSATPARISKVAPHLGEQTDEILREAGLTQAEIDALVADGVASRYAPAAE